MATVNTQANLEGYYKVVYGELEDLTKPDGVKFTKLIPFAKPNERQGYDFREPLVLSLEHGR